AGELGWAELILIIQEQTKISEAFERNTGTCSATRRNNSSYSPPEIISPLQTDRFSSTQGVWTCWSVTDIGQREETLLDPPRKSNGQPHITTTLHGVSQMERKAI
uniref:Uncharacterized protein n=1 Tax=Parascaris univalens TaxID=6257 RepID=A0A915A5B6_PARUN